MTNARPHGDKHFLRTKRAARHVGATGSFDTGRFPAVECPSEPMHRVRHVAVRLGDVPLEERMRAAQALLPFESDSGKYELIAAAMWPSDTVYWIWS